MNSKSKFRIEIKQLSQWTHELFKTLIYNTLNES